MDGLSFVKKNYIQYINKIIMNHKISHSYLIEVDNYEEDLDFVLFFIKMILCDVTFDKLDSNNPIVSLIDSRNYPDLFLLEPEGNSFKKEQLISLQKEFQNSSLLNSKRIYVIQYAEKFNSASANSLLKFLEEPEDNIIAFLLTDNRYHVLDTILSRCQVLSLKEYHDDYFVDDTSLELLSYFVNPHMFFKKYNTISNHIFLDKQSFLSSIDNVEKIFLSYLHHNYHIINEDFNSKVIDILQQISVPILISYISIIEKEKEKLEFNVNFKLFLDSFYAKLILEVI